MSQVITLNQGRYYQQEKFYFPSVSTILNKVQSIYVNKAFAQYHQKLRDDWGVKKGDRKKELPLKVGNYIDEQLKNYLLENDARYLQKNLGRYLLPWLDDNIERVISVDEQVIHKNLQYAGTLDAYCTLKDGKNYVIDFKTAKKMKSRGSVKRYCLQCAAYALVLESQGKTVDGFILPIIYKGEVGKNDPRWVDIFVYDKEELEEYQEKWLNCLLEYYSIDDLPF